MKQLGQQSNRKRSSTERETDRPDLAKKETGMDQPG